MIRIYKRGPDPPSLQDKMSRLGSQLPSPAASAVSTVSLAESNYENMYEMLIEDLLMMRFLMPRQAHLNLLAQLVARGHIGLQQFLMTNGRPRPASPTPASGSRDNLNVEELTATAIGNSLSA